MIAVAAIVVLYNPCREDIENIKEYYGRVNTTIVIDNSLKNNLDEIINILNVDSSQIIYEHFPQNIGLCKALNLAMMIAKKSKSKWAVAMDSDSRLKNDIINVYRRYIKRDESDIAVISPVHLHDRSRAVEYEGFREVKWAMTSGCLFNIDIFLKLGGFMEELFVDGLDVEYCYKARENGYRIIECGEAALLHHPAETRSFEMFGKKVLNYGYSSPWRYYMRSRAIIWLMLRYRTMRPFVAYLWGLLKVLLFFENKQEYLIQIKKGTIEGMQLYKLYKGAICGLRN